MNETFTLKDVLQILKDTAARSDWVEVERIARSALSQSRYYAAHLFLIHALLCLHREAEADQEFAILKSYKFNLAQRMAGFPQIAKRYQAQLDDDGILSMMKPGLGLDMGVEEMSVNTARWKVRHRTETAEEFCAEATVLLDSVLADVPRIDRESASICTFGSCFASNLARMMTQQGMKATNLLIEESVNSTFANRVLLEIVAGQPLGRPHQEMIKQLGEDFFEQVRLKLRSATHIILTVGVAPSFFDVNGGEFVFAKGYRDLLKQGAIVMRTTTCSENVANLQRVVALIRQIAPTALVVITVSPVPLNATTEMPSAVVADCVSKSVLRAAVHEVVSADRTLIYFPAFEIVRWLSGYTKTEIFGADDQASRHVSNWVVDFIVSSFAERFFAGRPQH